MLLLISGLVLVTTVARLLDMNAFLNRFHNYILPFLRGDDRVCSCICGRSRVDHVIPYGDQSGMDLTTNYSVSERVTRQELDMMLGLLLGVCACCLLLWLNGALQCVLAAWRDQQPEGQSTTGVGSWSWLTGLSDLGSWYRWMHHRQVDDSTRNIVHVKQALYHNGHPSL